jgi:hypothetical protein
MEIHPQFGDKSLFAIMLAQRLILKEKVVMYDIEGGGFPKGQLIAFVAKSDSEKSYFKGKP